MTINDIKRQLAGLTQTQKEEKAVSLIKEFAEVNRELSSLLEASGNSFDFVGLAETFLSLSLTADGCINHSKYDLYVEMCDAIDAESRTYDFCETLLSSRYQTIGSFEQMSGPVKNIYGAFNQRQALNKFVLATACLISNNDEFSEYGLRLLRCFIDDNDDSFNTVSSGNQRNMSSSEPEDVQLIKHNAVMARDDNDYVLSVGAELKNPNKNRCARNVRVKIIVKDNAGRILATSENTIEHIDSNAIFYYGDEFSIDRGIPANYTINVNCDGFVGAPENSTFADGITCSHYNLSKDRWDRTIFSGNVHNAYSQRLWTTLFFVFYDSAGNITGGTNTTVTLYGNSDDVFECRLDTTAQRDKVFFSPGFDFTDVV